MANRSLPTALVCLGLAAAWFAWRSVGAGVQPPAEPAPRAGARPAVAEPTPHVASPVVSSDVDRATAAPPVEREAAPVKASPPRGVVGFVRLPSGLPASGADVWVARRRTKADATGAFRIDCNGDAESLVALLAGHEPAVIEAVATRPEVVAGLTLIVDLKGPAPNITGWLVDAKGSPCKDWHIDQHSGGATIDHDGLPRLSAEDLAAGATAPSNDASGAGATMLPTGPRTGTDPTAVHPNDQRVTADGAFTIGGLRTGFDYVLRARNESTLQTVKSLPIRAGTQGFRFVVPDGAWRERVHGRAIDRSGGPIAGVRVRLTMRVHKSGNGESYQTGQEVRTDADGRFTFHRVPCEDLLLRFDEANVESLYHEFRADDSGENLLITLHGACRFRFTPVPGLGATTSLRVLDAGQQALPLVYEFGNGDRLGSRSMVLPAGTDTCEFTVSDRAAWLVLEVDAREIRRLPLLLRRGETLVVRG